MRKEFQAIEQCTTAFKNLNSHERRRVINFLESENYEFGQFEPSHLPQSAPTVEPKDGPKEEKKTKASKPKDTTAPEAVAETPEVEADIFDAPAPTKEDVQTACSTVVEKKGLPKAKEILKEFDAKRISEVKEADYAKFIAKCAEAVK